MENAIKIQLPVSLQYPALEGVLKKQMVGEYIPRQEEEGNRSPYAKILDVSIQGSSTLARGVFLKINIKILRTVLKRDQVELHALAILDYDNTTQQLFVSDYKVNAKTSSGFYNSALEMLANKVAYHQIIKKARINLKQLISKEIKKVNGLLEDGMELKGLKLKGKVEVISVQDITPQPDKVSLLLEVQGNLDAEIFDLVSLMPPK